MIVHWNASTEPGVEFVRVSYMDVSEDADGPLRELTLPEGARSAKLLQHLELHRKKYEICAEFIRSSGEHGFRGCVHEFLTAGYNPFNPLARPDAAPRAVLCGTAEITCRCEPSNDKGEATRVFWQVDQDPALDTTYVVHYAREGESDFEEPTHETATSSLTKSPYTIGTPRASSSPA
uniref:Fibronectin type-III domain-containing protein n=2 Tax=Steinernema glaseri TaxID=37863 RepID=A0A1I7YHW4_9BILA